MAQNTERDARIVQLYLEGATQEVLANRFQISEQRVGQIIKRAGMTPKDRHRTNRNKIKYSGVLLDPGVDRAMRKYIAEHKLTISSFIGESIEARLKTLSVPIIQEITSNEADVPLPLEG